MRDLAPHKCSPSFVALLHTGSPAGSVGNGSGKDSSIVFITPASPSPRQNATRGLALSHTVFSTWSQALRAGAGTGTSQTMPTIGSNTSSKRRSCLADCIRMLNSPGVIESATGSTRVVNSVTIAQLSKLGLSNLDKAPERSRGRFPVPK